MEPGRFTFTLTATDAAGNSDTDTVTITAAGAGDRFTLSRHVDPIIGTGTELISLNYIVVHDDSVLAVDTTGSRITEIDLATGDRTDISSAMVGTGMRFESPNGIVLDSANNRLLVADASTQDTIVAVALDTGNRSLISRGGDDAMGSGDPFVNPRGLALDSTNNRVFVVDDGLDAIVSVSLATATLGDRTIFSRGGDSAVGSGDAFDAPYDIVLDSANNRLLVTDSGLDAIVSVSLASGTQGNRTIFSRGDSTPDDGDDTAVGSGDDIDTPLGLALDSANNRLLVTDVTLNAIVAVALDTGNRSIISRGGVSPTGNGAAFLRPISVAIDSDNERLLVADIDGSQFLIGILRTYLIAVYLTDPEDPSE